LVSQRLSTPIQTRHSRHLNPKLLIALSRPLSGRVIFPTCNPTLNPTISLTHAQQQAFGRFLLTTETPN
jgi:hypothetical protein